MNNEPVAWMLKTGHGTKIVEKKPYCEVDYWKPLYTHPHSEESVKVKEQKCVVQNCENHKHEGSFNGDLCSPCYQFIAHGKGVYSQAYRNSHLVKELTDEEWKLLDKVINDCADTIEYRIDVERLAFKGYEHCSELETLYEEQKDVSMAKAILRKAQEK